METVPANSSSLHPLLWVAGISVTLLSLVGIASLTGLLPAREQPAAIVATAPATVLAPPVAPVPAAVVQPLEAAPQAPAIPAAKPHPAGHAKTAKKPVGQGTPANPAMLPPPSNSGVPPDYVPPPAVVSAPPAPPPCLECGVIANVREVTHEAQGSGAGAIVGGLLGGALANNFGKGGGRTLATVAGAVGGGVLGNTIEKSQHRTVSYQVAVRMENGSTRLIDSSVMPAWRIGEPVRIVNGAIASR